MFKISNTHHEVIVQGDTKNLTTAYLYTLSMSMLTIQRDTATMEIVSLYANGGGIEVRNQYYTDPQGRLEIPLRNIVNKYKAGGVSTFAITLNFNELDGTLADSSVIITAEPIKGISYNDLLAPRKKDSPSLNYEYRHDLVLPPNIIVCPNVAGHTLAGVVIESNYQDFEASATWAEMSNGLQTEITPSGERNSQLVVHAYADELVLNVGKDDPTIVKKWRIERADVCTDLVAIRWTSLTGCVRQNYFPIVGYVNEADEEISIIEAGNGYDIRKNVVKGIVCRLEGLTAYSCWYYQDLLMASDAHAVVKQTEVVFSDEMESMETSCHVSGGMGTSPRGIGFFDFEFTVKLRHYDTF